MLLKTDCMNIIALFEDLFDIFVVLLHLRTRHHLLMPHTHKTFCYTLHSRSDHQQALFALLQFSIQTDRGQPLSLHLTVYCCRLAVDYNWQFVQTGLLNILY